MTTIKIILVGLGTMLLTIKGFAQINEVYALVDSVCFSAEVKDAKIKIETESQNLRFRKFLSENYQNRMVHSTRSFDQTFENAQFIVNTNGINQYDYMKTFSSLKVNPKSNENEPFLRNRRNFYSSIWAFASLNYIYADLTGLMDKNILSQYQKGVVNSTKITPNFLAAAAVFMQIPLSNVLLPQIIKNEKTLRWVQIASGTLMTLVQAGTLFIGKPTPHYTVFSVFEMAATTFITIDAIKWKKTINKRN